MLKVRRKTCYRIQQLQCRVIWNLNCTRLRRYSINATHTEPYIPFVFDLSFENDLARREIWEGQLFQFVAYSTIRRIDKTHSSGNLVKLGEELITNLLVIQHKFQKSYSRWRIGNLLQTNVVYAYYRAKQNLPKWKSSYLASKGIEPLSAWSSMDCKTLHIIRFATLCTHAP